MTITISLFLDAVRRLRRGDVVIVTTNPPTLPYAVAVAARIRQASCVLLVHDVYPEVLVASGWLRADGTIARVLRGAQHLLFRGMSRIVVIGRDMERLIAGQSPPPRAQIVRIPNWADLEDVTPGQRETNQLLARLRLGDKFIVQYSGNMGRTHGIHVLVDVAEALRSDPAIHFLFIGGGAKRRWLDEEVVARELINVTVLPFQARAQLGVSLGASDLAVVSLGAGMVGASVPSRMYNILASGRPILAIAEPDSELALLVTEEQVGWLVPPGDVAKIVAAIREAKSEPEKRSLMAARGRHAAESKYSYERIIGAYRRLIDGVIGGEN